jgi:predicted AAA+ superfamily ATPase
MEMERVMNFLMQTTEPASTGESIGVLPIIGSAGVGKSTLVAHVYNSEKVREHFTRIVLVTHEDLKNRRLAALKDEGMTIHKSYH